jgi:hypothetical protein
LVGGIYSRSTAPPKAPDTGGAEEEAAAKANSDAASLVRHYIHLTKASVAAASRELLERRTGSYRSRIAHNISSVYDTTSICQEEQTPYLGNHTDISNSDLRTKQVYVGLCFDTRLRFIALPVFMRTRKHGLNNIFEVAKRDATPFSNTERCL